MERRVSSASDLRTITLTQTYATTVEDLWSACTEPARLSRWFLPVTGDLVVGGGFSLKDNAHGTISECSPPAFFRATWEYDGSVSWIAVRFLALPEGARLELNHTMPVDDRWTEFGPGATGIGWEIGFLNLGLHVTGHPVEDEETWAATPEGQRSLAKSAEGWGAAHIESGEDPAAARSAAARAAEGYGVVPA